MISTALLTMMWLILAPSSRRIDPLKVARSAAGFEMMDAMVGSDARVICVSQSGGMRRCPPGEAVRVEDVPQFGQLLAEWDLDDPRTLNVYLFGGEVAICMPVSPAPGARIRLKRLPLGEMGDPDGWDPAKIARFAHVPDTCGDMRGDKPKAVPVA